MHENRETSPVLEERSKPVLQGGSREGYMNVGEESD